MSINNELILGYIGQKIKNENRIGIKMMIVVIRIKILKNTD